MYARFMMRTREEKIAPAPNSYGVVMVRVADFARVIPTHLLLDHGGIT